MSESTRDDDGASASPAASGFRGATLDAVVLAALTVLLLSISIGFELSERIGSLMRGQERWQLDEVLLTLVGLVVGLAWFSVRRLNEARAEALARRAAESTSAELLEQNRALARQAINAQEDERRRIARELHDELGQCCTAIKIDAASIERHVPQQPAIASSARAILENASTMHEIVRGMLHRLRQPMLDQLDFVACLQDLAETWEQRHGIACAFVPDGRFEAMNEAAKLAIYRIVQESLNNAARHSGADQVTIRLGQDKARNVALVIEDNGKGSAGMERSGGLGILGMTERARSLGGELTCTSRPGGGFRVTVHLTMTEAS